MTENLGTSGAWAIGAVAVKPVDTSPRTATATSGSTISFCKTIGSGTDRLTLVGVSLNAASNATSISSITFTPVGGSARTLSPVIFETLPWLNRYSAIYSLVNPPSGQAGTVLVTVSPAISSGGIVVGAASFAGVDQTTPLGVPKGTSGTVPPCLTLDRLTGDGPCSTMCLLAAPRRRPRPLALVRLSFGRPSKAPRKSPARSRLAAARWR